MKPWADLWDTYKRRRLRHFLWLLANLGGLIVAYVATLTIWTFFREVSSLLPGPEVFLVTGAISLAIAGATYLSVFAEDSSQEPHALVMVTWVVFFALIYGVLIVMGIKKPIAITKASQWSICIFLFAVCLGWATITWLHQEALILSKESMPPSPTAPPASLQQAAQELPRVVLPAPPVEQAAPNE